MKVRVDLPQNHQKKYELGDLLVILDVVHDLIRCSNFEDDPVSFVFETNGEGIVANRVAPTFEPDSTTSHLRLVH